MKSGESSSIAQTVKYSPRKCHAYCEHVEASITAKASITIMHYTSNTQNTSSIAEHHSVYQYLVQHYAV